MKCPICDKEIKDYNNDYINHTVCEEHAKCKDEHHFYHYQYTYGSTEEAIGNVVFYSHYSESQEERELRNKQYKAVLELEREYYRNKIAREG